MNHFNYFIGLENKDIISVITVTKKNPAGLKKTLDSIALQSYPNLEVIVVDGGACEESISIINMFKNIISRWVSEQDDGIYFAMNKGLEISSGGGVIFMNSGDIFEGDVLNAKVKVPAIFGCKLLINNKKVIHKPRNIYFGMPTSHQCFLYQNTDLRYNIEYEISADYDFTLRNLGKSRFHSYPNSFIVYENNGISYNNYWQRDWENFLIIKKNLGIFRSVFFLIYMLTKNFFKKNLRYMK